MASTLQTYNIREWKPKLNTRNDAALLKPNEVQTLENAVLASNDMAKSRGGLKFWDYIGVGVSRASSSTTRTLIVTLNAGENLSHSDMASISADDQIAVFRAGSPNTSYDVKKITLDSVDYITNYPNVTLTYTMPGSLTESTTADTDIRIAKYNGTNEIVLIKDFWYIVSNAKTQASIAMDDDAKIYKYASDGKRTQDVVIGTAEVSTFTCTYANLATGDYLTLYTDDHRIEFWLDLTGADSAPAGSGSADYQIPIDVSSTSTDDNLASTIATEINKHPELTASAATNTVTVTHVRGGTKTTGSVGAGTSMGSFTEATAGAGLTITTPIERAYATTLGNKLLLTFSGVGNKPWIWDGTGAVSLAVNRDYADVDVNSTNPIPDIEFTRVHQGRIYATDKTDPDKLHYSDISEPERWNGEGDSGALVLDSGDGDSSGISSILPPFKGRLIIGKGGHLYQIIGIAPLQQVQKITDSIGSISHGGCVAVDQDDIAYVSLKGFHSMAATDQYGDFDGKYLSFDIQPNFDALTKSNLHLFSGVYIPKLSSIFWILKTNFNSSTTGKILCLNVEDARWYFWDMIDTSINLEVLGTFNISNEIELLIGRSDGLLLKYNPNNTKDLLADDIKMNIKTGIIYPDSDPTKVKGFKQAGVIFKSTIESTDFNFNIQVDDQPEQSNAVQESLSGVDILGTDFNLGSSVLGTGSILLPENVSLDGYGFGASLQIISNNELSISGFTIDFEPAGDQREVVRN